MDRTPGRDAATARAADLIAAVETALADASASAPDPVPVPTAYRDDTPLPAVGDALPVAQPGRAPMSQRATDASALMLAGGAGTLMAGTGTGVALWALAGVDPLALALVGGSSVAVLATLVRLVRRAGQAAADTAPVTHNHHYNGPVDARQEHHTAVTTRAGLIARTTTRTGR
ncbi:hypothetical protein [Streptomyces sp. NPDC088557]|uniref:hypothetical protein n=1 Tax=Streptomyces sp. NPDC088557 TaxID=3365867 RepID=UPI0037FF7016